MDTGGVEAGAVVDDDPPLVELELPVWLAATVAAAVGPPARAFVCFLRRGRYL